MYYNNYYSSSQPKPAFATIIANGVFNLNVILMDGSRFVKGKFFSFVYRSRIYTKNTRYAKRNITPSFLRISRLLNAATYTSRLAIIKINVS